jgi:protein TonB
MSDLNLIVPKADHVEFAESQRRPPEDLKQHRLMVGSLCLLLLALSIVLWRERDFWFPVTPQAESVQPVESSPVARVAPVQSPAAVGKHLRTAKRKHHAAKHLVASGARNPNFTSPAPPPPATITARTVLPPLEVEVVAGDMHRTVRPGSSSVRVDLQPGTPQQPITGTVASNMETAASVTSNAAERVPISADASQIVARPVRPNYPLLARQMRVQGSVILQALIGRDGVIQNLRVVSGPHILASAAQDAVRQWHFKPHFQGSEAVETQAKITVNFTISTN